MTFALGGSTAHAQTDPAVFPIDMISPVIPGLVLENILADPASRSKAGGSGAPTVDITRYHASPAVTARVKQQYVDLVRKTVGARAADQYDAVLRQHDPVDNWASLVADEGFHPGDVAEAIASYWMLSYLVANGQSDGPRGAGAAVAQQVRGVFSRNRTYMALDEAQRQELAEGVMLKFLTQQAAYSQAVKNHDADLKRRLGDVAVTQIRSELGIDLRSVVLTSRGFATKG
ncbi:MAG TPA: DUF6683 family protein [Gemmatimonadaceae bacterium]|nr:DUF6683 family protein [Gemmatimonadaceae bacterium]